MLKGIEHLVSKIKKKGGLRKKIIILVHNGVELVFTRIWSKVQHIWLGAFEMVYYLENDTITALMILL